MMQIFESRVVVLGLRIAQAIFALIVLGLTAFGTSSARRTKPRP
jgi:hypothetical protein